MEHLALKTVTMAMVFGVSSYILARWLRIPAILFYLVSGVAAGPLGFGLVTPADLGSGLLTMVEITVAVILFEGGLSLSSHSFKAESSAIRRILLFTLPLTGIGAALLGHWFLDLSWRFSLFFGALIVVTGPTVVGSILKSVYLTPRLEILLNWESIWGDVIGVLLSAAAIEMLSLPADSPLDHLMVMFAVRIILGTLLGFASGFILSRILNAIRKLRDNTLSGVVALAGALATFTVSNLILESSGPLAVAVAGFFLSRLRGEILHEIRHFKEQISCLFISTMFVLLSAYINPMPLIHSWPRMLLVAFILGGAVRPLSVLLALVRTEVSLGERIFIGFIGPRGIVAVATAAYAAVTLEGHDTETAVVLNLTFAIIFLSGTIATLFCRPLAKQLKVLIPPSATGILIVGVNALSTAIADFASRYVPVAFLGTSKGSCASASALGHNTVCADILDADLYEDAAGDGFGRLLAVTKNDALNELVAHKASIHLDPRNVYRAPAQPNGNGLSMETTLHDRTAFPATFSPPEAMKLLDRGLARLAVLSPEEAGDSRLMPLLEVVDGGRGVRIVRDNRAVENDALYFVPCSDCSQD